MNERSYRRIFELFLNDYWGAFHEVLEAQSVNPNRLAGSLFDAVVLAHRRFAATAGRWAPALNELELLWRRVIERRQTSPDAPLSAREIALARAHFEAIYDALAARGTLYPLASEDVHSQATHGTPRTPLRPDAAA